MLNTFIQFYKSYKITVIVSVQCKYEYMILSTSILINLFDIQQK